MSKAKSPGAKKSLYVHRSVSRPPPKDIEPPGWLHVPSFLHTKSENSTPSTPFSVHTPDYPTTASHTLHTVLQCTTVFRGICIFV